MLELPVYIWDEIFDEIISSSLSLRRICERYNITERDFWKTLNEDEGLFKRYEACQKVQVEKNMAEVISIADESTVADVEVAKLRIAVRERLAKSLKPEKYGEKKIEKHEGQIMVTHEVESNRAYLARLERLERLKKGEEKEVEGRVLKEVGYEELTPDEGERE